MSYNAKDRDVMDAVSRGQVYAGKPRRIKFTLRYKIDFSHSEYVNIFHIDGNPILHVVDEATRYQTSRCCWPILQMVIRLLYMTLPANLFGERFDFVGSMYL